MLSAGGGALDAAIAATHVLEDAPMLNAGVGATQDASGGVRLDASIMRASDLMAGAVAQIPPTRHVVDLARAVMERSPHVLLVGPEALRWGAEHGIQPCPVEALARPPEWARDPDGEPGDTVGVVALDRHGELVSATSTGGTPGRHPARVGDVPLIGCGTYADPAGAASSTGTGEVIIRVTLARACVDAMRAGEPPADVARRLTEDMTARTGGTGGVILVNAAGEFGVGHTTGAIAWAARTATTSRAGWRIS